VKTDTLMVVSQVTNWWLYHR